MGAALGRSSDFRDVFVYIDEEDNSLTIRSLPELELRVIKMKQRPTAFAIFDNQKMIIVGNEKGEFNLLWDPLCVPEH